jgi:hypothetical protein
MSFAINPSLNHINVPVTCIDELYRSTSEIPLPDARFRGRPCEAFICISKIEKTVKAYVAILDNGLKSVLVYTSDYEADNPADYPKVTAQAEEFLKTMGFTMEQVNLEFSPAMKEVIIKGFRVMRPPPPPPPRKQVGRYPKAEYAALDHSLLNIPAQLEDALNKEFQVEELPAELASLRAELASARAVIEKITREKVTTEQNASREIASLKSAVEQANDSRKTIEERLTQELRKLGELKGASQAPPNEDEKNKLLAQLRKLEENARLSGEKVRKEIAELQEKNRQLESERVNFEHQLAGSSSLQEKIKALNAEKESLKVQLTEADTANRAAADKIAELARFEESWIESQERENELSREIDQLQIRLMSMEEELQSHRDRESTEESLLQKISGLEAVVEAANAEIVLLRNSTVDADKYEQELKALEEGKDVIESEYVRLANESREKEITLTDALSTAESEVHRLSRELEIQIQVAAMEQSALRAELRRIVMGGATAAPLETIQEPQVIVKYAPLPPAGLPAGTGQSLAVVQPAAVVPETVQPLQETDIAEDDTDEPDLPVQGDPEIRDGLINELGSYYSDQGYSSTEFSIDPAITSIEYSDPSEIVALFHSSNTVQAVPVGSSIQRCKGYVIGIKKSGSYLTYVVWYLTESKKSVICAPEQQPEDSSECISILQDAVNYFEVVGFMMEFEELGSTTRSYKKALKKVPALKRAKTA